MSHRLQNQPALSCHHIVNELPRKQNASELFISASVDGN